MLAGPNSSESLRSETIKVLVQPLGVIIDVFHYDACRLITSDAARWRTNAHAGSKVQNRSNGPDTERRAKGFDRAVVDNRVATTLHHVIGAINKVIDTLSAAADWHTAREDDLITKRAYRVAYP